MENQFQVIMISNNFADNLAEGRGEELNKAVVSAIIKWKEGGAFSEMAKEATAVCENAVELFAVATFIGKVQTKAEADPITQILNALKQ